MFTRARPECPNPEYWHAPDIQATENEVSEGIFGLVRMLQPNVCLETGSYHGDTSFVIGRALQANGHGKLYSVELDPTNCDMATAKCRGLPVEVACSDSLVFVPPGEVNFAWIDSGDFEHRIKEFTQFRKYMARGSIVCFHDTGKHRPSFRRGMAYEGLFHVAYMPTPRGVAICEIL